MTNKNPYYIITPPYRRTSAGIRVLYRLCSLLNLSGYPAYLFIYPYQHVELASSPVDNTPILTESIAQYHFDIGLTPIVIAPESINVTKFSPPIFVRYYLHYKSFLNDINDDQLEDFSLFYTQRIRDKLEDCSQKGESLFILVSNPWFFTPPPGRNIKRSGCAFYAGKYKDTFNQKTSDCTKSCVEITRDKSTSQSPAQIREIFRSVEVFYSYEDTALTIEANLCGCPVIFVPNKYLEVPLIESEMKKLGYTMGHSDAGLEHAKSTVDSARNSFINYYTSPLNLSDGSFIYNSQNLAKDTHYSKMFAKGYFYKQSSFSLIMITLHQMIAYIRDFGLFWFFGKVYKRIKTFRFYF